MLKTQGQASQVQNPSTFRFAFLYARLALAATFLSALSVRFGIGDPATASESFAEFIQYTAKVNSFLPESFSPFLAWTATILEIIFALALIIGVRVRLFAFLSAGLIAMFGLAMAISLGIQPPLNYSVFSASSAALLLGLFMPQNQPDEAKVEHQASQW